MSMIEVPQLLTVKEACAVLRTSRSSIYRLIEAKKLPVIRIMSKTLISAGDIEDYINRCRSTIDSDSDADNSKLLSEPAQVAEDAISRLQTRRKLLG